MEMIKFFSRVSSIRIGRRTESQQVSCDPRNWECRTPGQDTHGKGCASHLPAALWDTLNDQVICSAASSHRSGEEVPGIHRCGWPSDDGLRISSNESGESWKRRLRLTTEQVLQGRTS